MTIFNNILFLQNYPSDSRADEAERSYAQGYGNRLASAKVFAPLGHHLRDARGSVRAASSRTPRSTHVACTAGACG